MGFINRNDHPDANTALIVKALRTAGVHVFYSGRPADLICYTHQMGRFKLLEVKNPARRSKNGNLKGGEKDLRPDQRKLLELGPADFSIIWNIEEALAFCGVGREG